jgi:hypothetical protein
MTASIAFTLFQVNYADMLARQMEHNQVDVLVLTPQEYLGILLDKARLDPRLASRLHAIFSDSPLGQYWTQTVSPNAGQPWVAPTALASMDAYLIGKTLQAVGIAGAASFVKTTSSGTYIIIKGYAGRRGSLLQGTRYLASNPRMVQMGLGMRGLQNVAKGGFILSVVVASGLETLDFIFNDEKTMHDLVGGIGVEAVKAGLATMAGMGAATLVAGVTSVAILPLAAMAVAVLVTGYLLNAADQRWQIKQRVVSTLKGTPEQTPQGLYRVNTQSATWKALQPGGTAQPGAQEACAPGTQTRDLLCSISRQK